MGWPKGRSTQAHGQLRLFVHNMKAGGHVSAPLIIAASLSAGLQRHRIEGRELSP